MSKPELGAGADGESETWGSHAVDGRHLEHALMHLRQLRAVGGITELQLRACFLRQTVGVWYSGLYDEMDVDVGHVVYRLTDFMDPDERASTEIYPRPDDTDQNWITVEDWRQEWEGLNPEGIPVLGRAELDIARVAIMGSGPNS